MEPIEIVTALTLLETPFNPILNAGKKTQYEIRVSQFSESSNVKFDDYVNDDKVKDGMNFLATLGFTEATVDRIGGRYIFTVPHGEFRPDLYLKFIKEQTQIYLKDIYRNLVINVSLFYPNELDLVGWRDITHMLHRNYLNVFRMMGVGTIKLYRDEGNREQRLYLSLFEDKW